MDRSTSLLGLEITGTDYNQTVHVPAEVELIGRNEIRVSDKGILELGEGIVSSVRWVDVMAGGQLRGGGSVDSSVFNQGLVSVGFPADFFGLRIFEFKPAIVALEASGSRGLKIGGSRILMEIADCCFETALLKRQAFRDRCRFRKRTIF